METSSFKITNIRFQDKGNGFAIVNAIQIKDGEPKDIYSQEYSLKGTLPGIRINQKIEAEGMWSRDKYGYFFKVLSWKELMPITARGIESYLSSGLIKGIGGVYAGAIVKTFGIKTLEVLDNEPERLLDVPGIGKKRASTIIESMKEQKGIRDVMLFLKNYDISNSVAAKIYAEYGNESIAKLKENPYRLADDIIGIGFKKADEVAFKLGIPKDSPDRIKSGIIYALNDIISRGHTYYPKNMLVELALSENILNLNDANLIIEELGHLEINGKIIDDEDKIYLAPFYYAEIGVSSRLRTLMTNNKKQPVRLSVKEIEKNTGCKYEELQAEAIETAQREPIMILTGLPGTGKTTVSKAIIASLEMQKKTVFLAAPTGRAAKRLSETTGRPASTIHRLLEYGKEGFGKNESNPLECDALLVDESSMIDIVLMNNLMKAIPNEDCKLILVGDIDQLPSVGAGNVLRDLIESNRIPTVRLTKIFRQALNSQIVVGAHAINAGKFPTEFGKDLIFIEEDDKDRIQSRIINMVKTEIPNRYGIPSDNIQVLSPMKRSFDPIGTTQLNKILQNTLNPQSLKIKKGMDEFRLGDKVMQMKNNYDMDIFNGDTGTIKYVNTEEDQLTVSFDGENKVLNRADFDNLSLAYACTVHKSQGSEYPVVIFPVHETHYILHERNLLYTAITRAKKMCILIGTKTALHTMISRIPATKRFTALDERIKDNFSPGIEF